MELYVLLIQEKENINRLRSWLKLIIVMLMSSHGIKYQLLLLLQELMMVVLKFGI